MSCFIDSLPHGVLLLDSEHRVLDFNRFLEAMTGYNRQDAKGVRGEYIIRGNFGTITDPVGKVLESDESLVLEGDCINQNRKKIPIRFVISPLRDTSSRTFGAVLVLEDISLLRDLDDKVHGLYRHDKIIGHSPRIKEILELLPIAARTDSSALITGETGTGKDLVAESIHNASKRARHPFIKVNCGAIPESLLESELFGHVRGAFTGADRDKPGMFRLAHGGTIFLTEIGDLSLPLQVKLLTVLDDKEFFPVGGSKKIKVDARIIAATHRDLGEFVRLGKFREDLYYRLNVLRIHLPALREREDDFRLLLDYFLREISTGLNKKIKGFSAASLELLSAYRYPGNIRELRNIVEYAINVCPDETIQPEHLPKSLLAVPETPPPSAPDSGDRSTPAERDAAGDRPQESHPPLMTGPAGWGEVERTMILEALTKTGGSRTRAAELLGWSRSKLWRKIKNHGLE